VGGRVVKTFPEQQQQVWRLNREEGMTYREIAEALGISPKTVEKKMSASLKTLRNEMGEAVMVALIVHFL
jgi:RNA polymerase sigma-70 factor (ECF subfamily)